ncbi:MAG: CHRD domain-containing protein, partial [Blastocatellia bacterium]
MSFIRNRPFILGLALAAFLFPAPAIRRQAAARAQNSFTVVSAASYSGAALAAEEIVVGFGGNLATGTVVASAVPLPTSLGGTSVMVRDADGVERLAPLFFVSPTQINFQVPPDTAAGEASLTVVRDNANVATGVSPILAVAPSLFSADASGKGLASANALRIKADGAQVYEPVGRFDAQQNRFTPIPIDLGTPAEQVFLIIYGTGIRKHGNLANVRATIGGVNAEVVFAGPQGGFTGLDQLNLRIPRSLPPGGGPGGEPGGGPGGEMDVVVIVNGQASNTVRIAVKPVFQGDTPFLASLRPEGNALSPASGYSTLKLSAGEKSAVIQSTYSNLTTPEISAHIHGPADPGQDGPILFDFDTAPRQADGSFVWTFADIGATTVPQIIQALRSGRLYINIHSSRHPAGEIRGHYGVVSGSQTFTPPAAPPPLPGGPPTARDAARFLTQATFGPRPIDLI